MAEWNLHTCGHTSLRGLSGNGEVLSDSLCHACRQARIGETICFARHGAPPASGQSRNHREQSSEAGVSVYEVVNGAIDYTGWYFDIADRPLYRGKGIIIGWGSDGEPLVRILSIRKARK